MKKVAMAAGKEVTWEKQHGFHSLRPIWNSKVPSTWSFKITEQHWAPNIIWFWKRNHQLLSSRLIKLDCFHYERRTRHWQCICLLLLQRSCQNHLWTYKCLIHHRIFYSIISNLGTHFMSNKMWECVPAHGIHWFYHASKAADLIEQWNDILKTVKNQLGGNNLPYWVSVLKIQHILYVHDQLWCCFAKSQHLWFQKPKDENGINLFHLVFSNKLETFLFLFSTNLGSGSLEIFALKGGILPEGYTAMFNCELRLPHGYFRCLC